MPDTETDDYGRWVAVMSYRRRTRLALLLTLVTAVLLLVLIGASIRGVLWSEQKSPPMVMPAEATIPSALGGLQLVETVTGDEGLAQVNRMHGKDIRLDRGFIAQYSGSSARATMWTGWAKSEAVAQALTDRMTAKIGPDHPVFQDLQVLNVSGRTIYAATGQGQQHYYFRSGTAVVWVAVDNAAAQEVVHDALKEFP
jgi:hypothetical protein